MRRWAVRRARHATEACLAIGHSTARAGGDRWRCRRQRAVSAVADVRSMGRTDGSTDHSGEFTPHEAAHYPTCGAAGGFVALSVAEGMHRTSMSRALHPSRYPDAARFHVTRGARSSRDGNANNQPATHGGIMSTMNHSLNRRRFLTTTGMTALGVGALGAGVVSPAWAQDTVRCIMPRRVHAGRRPADRREHGPTSSSSSLPTSRRPTPWRRSRRRAEPRTTT